MGFNNSMKGILHMTWYTENFNGTLSSAGTSVLQEPFWDGTAGKNNSQGHIISQKTTVSAIGGDCTADIGYEDRGGGTFVSVVAIANGETKELRKHGFPRDKGISIRYTGATGTVSFASRTLDYRGSTT